MARVTGSLRLSGADASRLQAEAGRSYPAEACGFLIGSFSGSDADVHRVVPAKNRAADVRRFLIDPRDVFDTMRAARAADEEILGVYHSHPDADAVPSATDEHEALEEWLHLVVSCREGVVGDMGCWRWTGTAFRPVEIVAADS